MGNALVLLNLHVCDRQEVTNQPRPRWVPFPDIGGRAGKSPSIFKTSAGHMTTKHPEFVGVLN